MGKFKTSDKEHWQCEKDGARAADQMHRPAYEGTSMETKPVTVDRMVTFADGNTLNYDISNLLLETKAQHAVKNRHHLHGSDIETGEVANAMADLMIATTAAGKKRKKQHDKRRRNAQTKGEKSEI